MRWAYLWGFILFVLMACEKDPCEGVLCQNEGYCTNGECVCPDGFTGIDCSEEIPPSRIRVTEVTVTDFPETREDGSSWDPDSPADIFPVIYDGSGNELWRSSAFYDDADGSLRYSFQVAPVLDLDDPLQTYIIRLFDFESFPPDELMGEVPFTPYMANEGFPSTITVENGESLTFLLEVEYF